MGRLAARIESVRRGGGHVLVCYVTAGDPSLEETAALLRTLDRSGADVIELGIPFSDPLADGPVIQAASQRALDRGATLRKSLDLVASVRRAVEIPIVVMSYFNPIHRYGVDDFCRDAASAGVDGAIVTDLTPEEAVPWTQAAASAEIETVFLVAPTSTDARIKIATDMTTGFVYCVSRMGVTGAKSDVPPDLRGLVLRVRRHTRRPICVGFGISEPAHVRSICEFADGVVVGSALVQMASGLSGGTVSHAEIAEYVSGLKAATR